MIENLILAQELRKRSTEAEKIIWRYLRRRQLGGLKFRRQQPIGDFIVDFVCFEKNIIIEIDGGQHNQEELKDQQRDDWLKKSGYRILRIWNNQVFENIEGVMEFIRSNV